MSPLDADAAEVFAFAVSALPAGASVLEVGAGDGRLAARLGAAGFRVKAIDLDGDAVSAARARGVDAAQVDVFDLRGERFDALLFTRSFHHLAPLDAAIAQARALVAPAGTVVLDELALDAMDLAGAAWFYDVHALLEEAGALAPEEPSRHHHHHHHHHHDREGEAAPKTPLERWQRRHAHDPPLHGGAAMVAALSSAFDLQVHERVPYLYRYLAGRLPPDERGARIFERVRALEVERIALGLLAPIGMRLVLRAL